MGKIPLADKSSWLVECLTPLAVMGTPIEMQGLDDEFEYDCLARMETCRLMWLSRKENVERRDELVRLVSLGEYDGAVSIDYVFDELFGNDFKLSDYY